MAKLKKYDAALVNLSEASTLFSRLVQDFPTLVRYQYHLVWSYQRTADVYRAQGDTQKSLDFLNRAATLRTKILQQQPEVTEYQENYFTTQNKLLATYQRHHQSLEVEETTRQSLAMIAWLLDKLPLQENFLIFHRAIIQAQVAQYYLSEGRLDDAMETSSQALDQLYQIKSESQANRFELSPKKKRMLLTLIKYIEDKRRHPVPP